MNRIHNWITFRAVLITIALLVSFARAQAAPYERHDVTFKSQGIKCSAWYYTPKTLAANEKRPAIVMAHGWSAVKDHLDRCGRRYQPA
jgi:uncharacterized protein